MEPTPQESPGSTAWAFDLELTPRQLRQAAAGGRQPLAALLEAHYPLVWRLAHSLCGDAASAAAVTQTILRQSLGVMPRWRNALHAENWFLHHTVLEARQVPIPASPRPEGGPVPMQALFKALRLLPFQQKEAFILRRGEKLDLRRTAVAMDCSTTAAANHLAAADRAIQSLAGPDFDRFVAAVAAACAAAPPPGQALIQQTVKVAARRKWRRRLRRWILAGVSAAAIGSAAWIIWKFNR